MAAFDFLRKPFSKPRLRSRRRPAAAPAPAVESLEHRLLLTNSAGLHDLEIVGRDSTGGWYASGYDAGGTLQHAAFAQWSPAVEWKDVLTGDFDGDGIDDLAGRDPASGNWYVALSDMTGATTRYAANWTPATTWSDVSVVDLPTAGDRGPLGHFTNKADLVGRAGDGTWWAAVSNGDGTFTNVPLTRWSPDAGWHDVRFLDANGDGAADIVGRASDGAWWAAVSGNGTYTTTYLAQWNEAANWQDVRVVHGGLAAWSAAAGSWWALRLPGDGTVSTVRMGAWSAAAGWHDVLISDLNSDQTQEILGRSSVGEWYAGTTVNGTLAWQYLGTWAEAAAWQDVRIAHTEVAGDVVVGRSSDGTWWAADLTPDGTRLATQSIGRWAPDAGWKDVRLARVTRPPIHVDRTVDGNSLETIAVVIQAQRSGTIATVDNWNDGNRVGLKIAYISASGFSSSAFVYASGTTAAVAWSITFDGHIGNDTFVNRSGVSSTAHGWAGDDALDGRDNGVKDLLRGGDGNDTVFGNDTDDVNDN